MLVDVIQRKLMGHCLQDLVCAKCKEVDYIRGFFGSQMSQYQFAASAWGYRATALPHHFVSSSCTVSSQVTQYNMARRGKCAGDFKHPLAVKDTVQLVNTFRGIALHYR